ncbi:hypothetical protein HNP86_001591 [Methanococcus maripaludis]|uniref:Uncharacterized protein n=1 Tax=Methanococcus maripaludis TaxID=39152 RepID=A0A7J9NUT8_METMI|nr:hypothetical protein [Methanococcus maripaludis]MBA2851438.1 hypothetical protein [Methanococcus maripaludis]
MEKFIQKIKRSVLSSGKDEKKKYLTRDDITRKYVQVSGLICGFMLLLAVLKLISGDFLIIFCLVMCFEFVLIAQYDFKKYVKKNKLAFKGLKAMYSDGTYEIVYFNFPSDYEEFVFDLTTKCNEHEVTVQKLIRLK